MAVAMLDRSQQASRYRPLEEVRRTLRVKWYRSPIDPKELRALMQRSDGKGLFQTLGVLALLTASGVITYYFFSQQMWVAFAIACGRCAGAEVRDWRVAGDARNMATPAGRSRLSVRHPPAAHREPVADRSGGGAVTRSRYRG